ncbi:MAG TPA: trypsin-like peptidase domain-containing protein [Geodermatophilus sp.]|jgi:serine protease Do|nr:trypsin-like peptidase domain-containing protein [Geodermatophilus sp.]
MSAVADLSDLISSAADRVGPAVVGIGRGWGLGSGVVVETGQVVTSAHNLRRDEVTVTFADGRREVGRRAGVDPDLDLAVVAVDTGDAPAVAWDPDATDSPVGAAVVALANPGGRGLRATLGFVSSSGRSFRGPRGRRIEGAIEHTAPLPRGSSGGPLVDAEGRLLGLNAVRLDGGLILAVPASARVQERVRALAAGRAPAPRRLGVAVAPPRVARRMRRAVGLPERPGLLVRAVEDDTPAEAAGVEAGDLIVAAGGRSVEGIDDLYAALDAVGDGGELPLTVVRGTEERSVTAAFAAAEGGR